MQVIFLFFPSSLNKLFKDACLPPKGEGSALKQIKAFLSYKNPSYAFIELRQGINISPWENAAVSKVSKWRWCHFQVPDSLIGNHG